MRKFCILPLTIVSIICYGQELLSKESINNFNNHIDSLVQNFEYQNEVSLFSLPQTTADYFQVFTDDPFQFLKTMTNEKNIENLKISYPYLIFDRNVLVCKYTTNYHYKMNEKGLVFQSYEIKNNSKYYFRFHYSDSLDVNSIPYVYEQIYDSVNHIYRIKGLKFKAPFKKWKIPRKYIEWVKYADYMLQPETKVFKYNKYKYKYIEEKPHYNKLFTLINQQVEERLKLQKSEAEFEINKGDSLTIIEKMRLDLRKNADRFKIKQEVLDSLYIYDPLFPELLENSIDEAIAIEYVSYGLSSEWALKYLNNPSKALELETLYPLTGTCSQDQRPRIQRKQIANYAGKLNNWPIFINTSMNLLNDYISRNSDLSITAQGRKTYMNELAQLHLDWPKILLATNLKFKDYIPTNKHYYSDNAKVGIASSQLDYENRLHFENMSLEVLEDKQIDPFNKLNLYNTLTYYLKSIQRVDSLDYENFNQKLNEKIKSLPAVLRDRLLNPNLQSLEVLDSKVRNLDGFEILSSDIKFSSKNSNSDTKFYMNLKAKNSQSPIVYEVEFKLKNIQSFFEKLSIKIPEFEKRIMENPYLLSLLQISSEENIYISNLSMNNMGEIYNEGIQENEETKKLTLDLNNALSIKIKLEESWFYLYLYLTKNGEIYFNKIPGFMTFNLPSNENYKSILKETYPLENKVFDKNGRIIR